MKKINQFSILLIACLTASMTSYDSIGDSVPL